MPSHKITDSKSGEVFTYCAATKQWSLVDPNCTNVKSLHNAGEDRVYLILKNKYTDEWEFPTTKLYLNQSIFRAKYQLFTELTGN